MSTRLTVRGMSSLAHLVTQAEILTSSIRREMFDGREHIVVPAVMAKLKVMNDAIVPPEEWIASVEAWNGRPVIFLHPEQNGQPISVASSPDVFEKAIGFVFNTKFVDDKLKGELWIDEKKVERAGQMQYFQEMLSGEVKEVSTGYISDAFREPGELNGERYTFVHRFLRPDHLAILPGQIGACSVADGCGAPRVNSAQCCDACAESLDEAIEFLQRSGVPVSAVKTLATLLEE